MVFLKSCSEKPNDLPFDKTLLDTGRATRGKMLVLDGFSRLVVEVIYFDMENRFFFESFSFVCCCRSRKVISL